MVWQGEVEMKRCVDAAAAEVQAILQGQRLPKGGVYQPPSQRGYNAVGPSAQVGLTGTTSDCSIVLQPVLNQFGMYSGWPFSMLQRDIIALQWHM